MNHFRHEHTPRRIGQRKNPPIRRLHSQSQSEVASWQPYLRLPDIAARVGNCPASSQEVPPIAFCRSRHLHVAPPTRARQSSCAAYRRSLVSASRIVSEAERLSKEASTNAR